MNKQQGTVELYARQVRDGSHYQGHVTIAGIRFDYELKLAVSMDQLDRAELPKHEEDLRRIIQLSVKKGDANLELSLYEYAFFIELLYQLVDDLYEHPNTRTMNKVFKSMLDDQNSSSDGLMVMIHMKRVRAFEFSPQLCEALSAPKFGCAL